MWWNIRKIRNSIIFDEIWATEASNTILALHTHVSDVPVVQNRFLKDSRAMYCIPEKRQFWWIPVRRWWKSRGKNWKFDGVYMPPLVLCHYLMGAVVPYISVSLRPLRIQSGSRMEFGNARELKVGERWRVPCSEVCRALVFSMVAMNCGDGNQSSSCIVYFLPSLVRLVLGTLLRHPTQTNRKSC